MLLTIVLPAFIGVVNAVAETAKAGKILEGLTV